MDNTEFKKLNQKFDQLLTLFERMTPASAPEINLDAANAFVWQAQNVMLVPVHKVNRINIDLLKGIDQIKATLLENARRFTSGHTANNALLWGARGMGKSSLIKAVHAAINHDASERSSMLKLIEIHREDIHSLPILLNLIRSVNHRIILFCDDLSFDDDDTSYKSLKAALDGGIEGRPENTIFYATSNRRHLLSRDMIENERSTAIHPAEAAEEKISLSDRFGLWLGFHKCNQNEYLEMIDGYAKYFKLEIAEDQLHSAALEWSTTRGNRSGRVAWHFIQDITGKMGKSL